MGLEKIIASEDSLGGLTAQSFSLTLAGGIAGGIALYSITKRRLNSIRKREGTETEKLYGIPHNILLVTMTACGVYVGARIVQEIPHIYSTVQSLFK